MSETQIALILFSLTPTLCGVAAIVVELWMVNKNAKK